MLPNLPINLCVVFASHRLPPRFSSASSAWSASWVKGLLAGAVAALPRTSGGARLRDRSDHGRFLYRLGVAYADLADRSTAVLLLRRNEAPSN